MDTTYKRIPLFTADPLSNCCLGCHCRHVQAMHVLIPSKVHDQAPTTPLQGHDLMSFNNQVHQHQSTLSICWTYTPFSQWKATKPGYRKWYIAWSINDNQVHRRAASPLVVVVIVITSTASKQRQQIVQAKFHILNLVATQRRLGQFPFHILKLA